MKKTLVRNVSKYILIAVLAHAVLSTVVSASMPSFPSCVNPQGSIVADYQSGVHGIPGYQTEHFGSDSVYSLSSANYLQCFCPSTGQGIQTNWLKVSNITQVEAANLKSHGWISILDGAAWGLPSGEYLAKNTSFICGGGIGGGEVLGLASTGDSIYVYGTFITGFILLGSGIFLQKRSKFV